MVSITLISENSGYKYSFLTIVWLFVDNFNKWDTIFKKHLSEAYNSEQNKKIAVIKLVFLEK